MSISESNNISGNGDVTHVKSEESASTPPPASKAGSFIFRAIKLSCCLAESYGNNLIDQYAKFFMGLGLMVPRFVVGAGALTVATAAAAGGAGLMLGSRLLGYARLQYRGELVNDVLEQKAYSTYHVAARLAMYGTMTLIASVGSPVMHAARFGGALVGINPIMRQVSHEVVALSGPVISKVGSQMGALRSRGNVPKSSGGSTPGLLTSGISHKITKSIDRNYILNAYNDYKLDKALHKQPSEKDREWLRANDPLLSHSFVDLHADIAEAA